ncbi:MAG: Glucose 1-dehydrogenase [Chlamydiae bacterium]|nr:Glucose 1-dehydrogenase [Chlamydiota bacterium]
MRFNGKKVVVTGGNSGIGKESAKQFIKEGALVAIIGRNEKRLEQTKNELGEQCIAYQADVSQVSELEDVFKNISEDLGTVDILVLNAGVSEHLETSQMTESVFDRMMDINIKGPYFTVQKALPFLNTGASIVAVSSISSRLGIKHMGVYAASKSALETLIRAFSAEFIDKQMRFNIISPGYTETPIFSKALDQDPHFFENASKTIPMKRMAQPIEITHSILFLASDKAKYITGANLVVDGGFSSIFPLDVIQEAFK